MRKTRVLVLLRRQESSAERERDPGVAAAWGRGSGKLRHCHVEAGRDELEARDEVRVQLDRPALQRDVPRFRFHPHEDPRMFASVLGDEQHREQGDRSVARVPGRPAAEQDHQQMPELESDGHR